MEWNSKPAMEWTWNNLAQFSTKAASHMSKQLNAPNHEIEKDSGSIYSSGGIGFSGSDLEHGSSSKSTISASGDSALKEGIKAYKSHDVSKDLSQKELAQADNTANFLSMGASASFGEKRMYSEDANQVSTVKSSPLSVNLISSTTTTKRSRAHYKSTLTPHCQVEGCKLDLKLAKDYHRRHRICESHSKSPKVIIAGMERRFCQQCSRFHELSNFDDKKRSCRRRLSDHNARRRRPQPQAIHFNPVRLSTSLYDGRHQMNIAFNRQMNLPTNEILDATPLLQIGMEKVLCYEGNVPQVFSQALQASLFASNLDIAPDLGHALSLLSTNTCGLSKPEPTSRDHLLMHGSQTSVAQLMTSTHRELDSWTASSSSEDKQVDQLASGGRVHLLNSQDDGNIHFQEFQFKAPYDPGCFYPSQIN